MNESTTPDIKCAAVGHCFLILLIAALLGEAVSAGDPIISVGEAGALIGWVAGVGTAHLLFTVVRGR